MSLESDRLQRSQEAEERGDLQVAINLVREAVERDASQPELWARLGHLYDELEQHSAAQHAFRQAVALDPEHTFALSGLGLSLWAVDRLEEAEGMFRRAHSVSGEASMAVLLADVLADLGREEEAEHVLRGALEDDPTNVEAMYNLGVLLRRCAPSEAESLFRASIRIDPEFAPPHRELALTLFKSNRPAEAEVSIEACLALDPGDVWGRIYLAMICNDRGDDAGAVAELRLATELSPLWGYPHRRLGEQLAGSGRWSEAEESFRQAIALDDRDAGAAAAFGQFLMESGRSKEASVWATAALKLDPAHEGAIQLLRDLTSSEAE